MYNKDMYTENDYVAFSHHEEAIYTMQPSLKQSANNNRIYLLFQVFGRLKSAGA